MKIETKFDLGQKVWFIDETRNALNFGKISGMEITTVLRYVISHNHGYNIVPEYEVFKTKAEVEKYFKNILKGNHREHQGQLRHR